VTILRAIIHILWLFAVLYHLPVQALPAPAGTWLPNVAHAQGTSEWGPLHVTSNVIRVRVSELGALTLSGDSSARAPANGKVAFRYVLTNSGSVSDRFDLAPAAAPGGDFALDSITLYADGNADGEPEGDALATGGSAPAWGAGTSFTTPLMQPGQSLAWVVVLTLPDAVAAGSSASLQLVARGNPEAAVVGGYTPASPVSSKASVIVSPRPQIRVTRTLSPALGPSPNDGILVTLSYLNAGSRVSKLTLVEAIGNRSEALPFSADALLGPGAPALGYNTTGLTYVAGSARWSGRAAALSEAQDGDEGGVQFSYDASTRVMRAVIASVPEGASGTLTFKVKVNAGLAAGSESTTGRHACVRRPTKRPIRFRLRVRI
jgi:hypothetical protein